MQIISLSNLEKYFGSMIETGRVTQALACTCLCTKLVVNCIVIPTTSRNLLCYDENVASLTGWFRTL